MFFLVDKADASHATECWSLSWLAGNKSVVAPRADAKTVPVAGGSWIAADTKSASFTTGGWITADAKPASYSTETSSLLAPLGAAMSVVIAMRHISVSVPILKNECKISCHYNRKILRQVAISTAGY